MNKKQTIQPLTLEDLLLAFRRKIMESMRKDDLHHGLTISQFEVLRSIGSQGSQTMKEIAASLKITPPSATVLIEEMEKKKLVIRENHPTDRRIVSIRLTKKSQDIFSRVYLSKKKIIDDMLSKLSAKDKKNLERIISIIISK